MAETKNLATVRVGDTWDGLTATVNINGSPANLVGSQIHAWFRRGSSLGNPNLKLSIGSGITLTGVPGQFTLDEIQQVNLEPGTYYYDVQIVFASGRRKTYMKGTWVIEKSETRDEVT